MISLANSCAIHACSHERTPIHDFWTSFVDELEKKYKNATTNEDEAFSDFSEWENWLIEEGEMDSGEEDSESGSMDDNMTEESHSRGFLTVGDMTFTAVESEEFTIVNDFTVKRVEINDVPYYDLLGIIQSLFVRRAENSNISCSDLLYVTESGGTRKTQSEGSLAKT